MKSAVLRKPLLTEKASGLAEKNVYTFEVSPDANKIEVAAAIKSLFNVDVASVRTMWMPIRRKSQFTKKGVLSGTKSRRKKAIIELKNGQTLDLFTPMDVKPAEGTL